MPSKVRIRSGYRLQVGVSTLDRWSTEKQEARSSLGCLSDASGAARQSVADQKRRGSRTKFVNCGTASSSEGRYWLPTYEVPPFLGYKVGIRPARHSRLARILRVPSEFSTVFLQEHFYVSAIEIEFRICFRVLAGRKAAEVLLQSIWFHSAGTEASRISSPYLQLCRSKAYLRTEAQNHVSWFSVPAGTLCAIWALRVALSAPPLVGCVPSGTLPRFLQLKSSLESAFEFIPVEKTAYLLLQEHLVPLRRDRSVLNPISLFGCAGVKPNLRTDAPKKPSLRLSVPAGTLARHLDAPTNRRLRSRRL